MSKADNIYWVNSRPMNSDETQNQSRNTSGQRQAGKRRGTLANTRGSARAAKTQWWAFTIPIALTFMLCLTINFRAYSELSIETTENSALETRIQSVTSENLSLQEEIHYLKNDAGTVEREARKFGLRPPTRK